MSKEELVYELEELLEVEKLEEDMVLAELEMWDSMAQLSLMSFARKQFDKKILVGELLGFKTVGDIIDCLMD